MARTGLYKSEVKKARDALIAQGINPSVDAVRVALGNTGSKTTIHKYLKELEEEGDGVDGRKSTLSDTLQDFVARLAVQLQEEANAHVAEIQAQYVDKDLRHAEVVGALKREINSLSTNLKQVEIEALHAKSTHEFTSEELHRETVARRLLEQQVTDLKERLAENEQHRQSLEEKHQHARDALEHYRSSVKEQRDQDQRRHEQQIQQMQAEMRQLQLSLVAKQDDVTRLNQEGARLVMDLSHTQKNLFDLQTHSRKLEQRIESLAELQVRVQILEKENTAQVSNCSELKNQLLLAGETAEKLRIELTESNATKVGQLELTAEIRTLLEQVRQKNEQ
jgi:chromosome segregation ATPase